MAIPRLPFFRKGKMHPFVHLSIVFWLYTALQCQSSMLSNSLVFHPFIQFTIEKEQNKLSFLDVLITHTEQGFSKSVYQKPTFTRQYLNFNFHYPLNVKKGIVCCLQHQANAICSDNVYQEMDRLRDTLLHQNNYPKGITSAPRNLDWKTEDKTLKLTHAAVAKYGETCHPLKVRLEEHWKAVVRGE